MFPADAQVRCLPEDTIKISGMEQCVYITDKGFFSQANIAELEEMSSE
jgi:transposase